MGSEQTTLVVEADATCRAFLADNLPEDGYQVASVETREQALALLGSRRAHLVLPISTVRPLGLLDAVRGAGGLRDGIDPHVPLVVVSSWTDELARIRAFEQQVSLDQLLNRRHRHGGDAVSGDPELAQIAQDAL